MQGRGLYEGGKLRGARGSVCSGSAERTNQSSRTDHQYRGTNINANTDTNTNILFTPIRLDSPSPCHVVQSHIIL